MALLNISEACKHAGISRTKMYAKFIDTGVISVTRDKNNKPQIDTSELVRVFGELQPTVNNGQQFTPNTVTEHAHKIALLELELQGERKLSAERLARIEQLDKLLMMLEHKQEKPAVDPQPEKPKRGWFYRFFD